MEMVFGSDNAAFLEALDAAGIRDRTVTLWPENEELAAYAVVRAAETGVVTAAVKDAGMSALYGFEGTHTVKFVAADDRGRTSYTVLAIRVRPAVPSPRGRRSYGRTRPGRNITISVPATTITPWRL